jgi:hypothetical protein
MAYIDCDVAIIIYSRGREQGLTRLLRDLRRDFIPSLGAAGLTSCVCVYAQGYSPVYIGHLGHEFAGLLEANEMLVIEAEGPHARIGEVAYTAIRSIHDRCRYSMAMLMDDDSVYYGGDAVNRNLASAARRFVDEDHRAYSIKLGTSHRLEYQPFVGFDSPIMPFKEKMLWVSRAVLDDVLKVPRFAELSIGEDAVISAVAWLPDPDRCFGVFGIATFLHLGFESCEELGQAEMEGGYAALMNFDARTATDPSQTKYDEALRTGVTPYHVLPDVFVPEDHPLYVFNAIRDDAAARVRQRSRA